MRAPPDSEDRTATALAEEVVIRLETEAPEFSARTVLTDGQSLILYGGLSVLLAALWWAPSTVAAVVMTALAALHTFGFVFKGFLAFTGRPPSPPIEPPLSEDRLPEYSVLVPLYRETAVVPSLLRALRSLDYPEEKLDIILIVEADDQETIKALLSRGIPSHMRIVRVPLLGPRTKPKALDYALAFARGTFCVVFDGEDQPEPDQLRRAAERFAREEGDVICLQARLNYFNARESWLTRLFAIDYCLWFDFLLPGLERIEAPILLGGTSNHFRVSALLAIGAWDPFNVTEDADLGMRIARLRLKVRTLSSTTFEEAPRTIRGWLAQRTRWLKGYMQTYLVHMRAPRRFFRETGWTGFLTCQLFLLGTIVAGLFNPVLWGLFGIWLATGVGVLGQNTGPYLFTLSMLSLLVGNALITYLLMMAPLRRNWFGLVPWALLSPVYWLLISIASWCALFQLLFAPFHWSKTRHGLTRFTAAPNLSGRRA